MKFQFNKLITGSFALAVLLLGLIGVVTHRSTTRLIETAAQVSRTHELMEIFEATMSDMADAETSQRGYVITGNEVFLAPYRSALADIRWHTNRLHELVADNPGQLAREAQLNPLIATKLTGVQETIRVRMTNGFAAAQARIAGGIVGGNAQPHMDEIRRLIEEMRVAELEVLRQRDDAARASARRTFVFAWAGSGISVLLLLLSFGLLLREIHERRCREFEIRGLNEDLVLRAAQLEAANQELEAFSYTVSHDLRAPLRHVNGFVELLRREPDGRTSKAEEWLKYIADSVRQMGSLIDNLLEFSRMARADLSVVKIDLPALVGEVRAALAAACPGRAITWHVGDLPEVRGDRAMLRLALVNLLGNAVKFTASRPQAEISVDSRPEDSGSVILVRDNGVGFDMNHVDKLFNVFQRLHHADEFEGTGIGLATVRRIIKRHGGRTWAEGAPDKGATFYFSLPKDPAPGGAREAESPGS